MLPTRDPPQDKILTQTESERLEKNISCEQRRRKTKKSDRERKRNTGMKKCQ